MSLSLTLREQFIIRDASGFGGEVMRFFQDFPETGGYFVDLILESLLFNNMIIGR